MCVCDTLVEQLGRSFGPAGTRRSDGRRRGATADAAGRGAHGPGGELLFAGDARVAGLTHHRDLFPRRVTEDARPQRWPSTLL